MKNPGRGRVIILLLVLALIVPLMAFTLRGGDSFEIYLGKSLIVNFPHRDRDLKTIDLSAARATDVLKVSYNHCGQTGTNRTISIKDNRQVIKEWKFVDIKSGGSTQMNIPVKEIVALTKNLDDKQLTLFYSSELMKEGKVLATLTSNTTQASRK